MKKFTWGHIFLKALLHPILFIKFLRLPRTYTDLDEWLEIDERKSEIVAKIIGCKNIESIKSQQRENMQYRKKFASSFSDWMELVKRPEHSGVISSISKKYEQRKMCHRQYKGIDAGVRCYCK